jgi:hypothetical protein
MRLRPGMYGDGAWRLSDIRRDPGEIRPMEHRAQSLLIGDGPGIAPSANGSVIDKMVTSAFRRRVFKTAGAGAFVECGDRAL